MNTNLMKWHIAAVKIILSLDQPNLPAEKVNRLIDYSQELKLQWSDNLLKFYLQATMRTCQIIKALSNEQMENPNRISRQSSPKSLY